MLILLLACTPSKSPGDLGATDTAELGADSGAETGRDPGGGAPDEADALYNPELLHEVEITLPAEDWDHLRLETRSIYDMLSGECLAAPWESPYTWVEAEVSIDGASLGAVGLRKKGLLGSASLTRPSLRIDTDRFVEHARYLGLEKIVLNNNNQDWSRMRTCLAHGFFADAGLVAPRCSLAHVTVNGEDMGIYDNTEAFDADLIERIEGAPPATLYEGRLSDLREGWLGTFEAKTDASDGADLAAVVDALDADDAEVLDRLDQVIDLDNFYRFWAAESIAGHWDGYAGNTNNFYVYGAPEDGRLRFIAAGPDAAFDSREPFGAGQPVWVATLGALPNRLIQIPEARVQYELMVRQLMDEAWRPDERLARLDALADLTHDLMARDERRAVSALRAIVEAKEEDILGALGGEVEVGSLRGVPCFVHNGDVTVDFSTTFGSYPDGDLFTGGEASTHYEISGREYSALEDGVSIGWYGDGRVFWVTISRIAEDTWLAPYVLFDPDLLVNGADIEIDGYQAEALLLYNSPDTGGQWWTAAYLGEGVFHLDEASAEDGDPVSGALDLFVLGSEG